MKKLVMTAAVLACAGIVSAQVYSSNIVGYTKVQAVGGELTLAAINFDTGGVLLADVMPPTVVPLGTAVYKWDKGLSTYATATLGGRGSWNNNFALNLGDALWIQAGGTVGATNEIIFAGEVLSGDASIALPAGIVATGYYFPVDQTWTATQMATDLANGSGLYVWDESTQSYVTASKGGRGSWNSSPAIGPANGFWVDNAGAAINVTEPQPY